MAVAEKFELFMCCLGNGTTVCNKAVYEHGDYKTIAHISAHGVIKFYVKEDYIPDDAMEKIQNVAKADKEKFLEKWNKKSDIQKYEYILNIPCIGFGGINQFNFDDMKLKDISLHERVEILEKKFFETHM